MRETTSLADVLVTLDDISIAREGRDLLAGISFTIRRSEQWAFTGPSGSGKTLLAKVLAGKIFHHGNVTWQQYEEKKGIALVEQQHHFTNLSNTSNFYYQQRFNAAEAFDSQTVLGLLNQSPDSPRWVTALALDHLLQKPVLQLSNGENKRLQLALALGHHPAVLILDNPFTGLDAAGRATLGEMLNGIAGNGIQLIVITAGGSDLPACITHIARLEEGRLVKVDKTNGRLPLAERKGVELPDTFREAQGGMPVPDRDFSYAVKMDEVSIRYGENLVLDRVSWEVKRGSCWSVSGPNGAGKSTLLSLVTADNPQAYANNIILFDRPRGSGESIWDIKRKIGFLSPEIHLYFDQQATGFEVVASGLFDTIGLFRQLNDHQARSVHSWLRILGLVSFSGKRMSQLSASQQRMLLLARALVKNPPLLVLDEPAQGLDAAQHGLLKTMLNEICTLFGTTLIYVSHYPADLPACITNYLVLDGGKAVK